MDEELEKQIMEGVGETSSDLEFSYAVYESLNANVVFSTRFAVTYGDLNKRISREEYEKDINQVTTQDNSVACNGWAKAYAYLLNKNGWIAIVVGEKHKVVEALKGDMWIRADGTDDNRELTDLLKAKLGMAPSGFFLRAGGSYKDLKALEKRSEKYQYPDIDSLSPVETDGEIKELLELIGGEDLSEKLLGYDKSSSLVIGILKKIEFMNTLLEQCRLGNSLEHARYIKWLHDVVLFDEKEKKSCKVRVHSLYREMDQELEVIPIVSIYFGNPAIPELERKGDDFRFLIFEEGKHRLTPISREELVEAVGTTIAKIVNGRIFGLPELDKKNYGPLERFFYED